MNSLIWDSLKILGVASTITGRKSLTRSVSTVINANGSTGARGTRECVSNVELGFSNNRNQDYVNEPPSNGAAVHDPHP